MHWRKQHWNTKKSQCSEPPWLLSVPGYDLATAGFAWQFWLPKEVQLWAPVHSRCSGVSLWSPGFCCLLTIVYFKSLTARVFISTAGISRK